MELNQITAEIWMTLILSAATLFTIFWSLDAVTHKKLVKIDISDQELQTHRNILVVSLLMEASLVGMFWFPLIMLPFFIAFFITRLVHEFIDELKYHADRCTPYESRLHLGMWTTVLLKTGFMFMWGFFSQYQGILELNVMFYVWGFIVFGTMGYVGILEWRR